MPQASEELRRLWGGENGVGEDKAMAHLRAAGFRLLPGWTWLKPSDDYEPTEADLGAIGFLIDEWDFGGIEPLPSPSLMKGERG